MNPLMKRAMDLVKGAGKSKAAIARRTFAMRFFPEGTRFKTEAKSRQIERAKLRDEQYRNHAVPPSAHRNNSYQPLPRKARRQMARAMAAGAWRNRSTAAVA